MNIIDKNIEILNNKIKILNYFLEKIEINSNYFLNLNTLNIDFLTYVDYLNFKPDFIFHDFNTDFRINYLLLCEQNIKTKFNDIFDFNFVTKLNEINQYSDNSFKIILNIYLDLNKKNILYFKDILQYYVKIQSVFIYFKKQKDKYLNERLQLVGF